MCFSAPSSSFWCHWRHAGPLSMCLLSTILLSLHVSSIFPQLLLWSCIPSAGLPYWFPINYSTKPWFSVKNTSKLTNLIYRDDDICSYHLLGKHEDAILTTFSLLDSSFIPITHTQTLPLLGVLLNFPTQIKPHLLIPTVSPATFITVPWDTWDPSLVEGITNVAP